MKAYIKQYGPLEVGIWAGNDLFSSVADMENNYRGPAPWGFDHEVSLEGYVDDSTVPGGGYWIIKNSWGYSDNTLGDYVNNGYYLIPYGNIECHSDISRHHRRVRIIPERCTPLASVNYYGTTATDTWKGTTSAVWGTTSSSNW